MMTDSKSLCMVQCASSCSTQRQSRKSGVRQGYDRIYGIIEHTIPEIVTIVLSREMFDTVPCFMPLGAHEGGSYNVECYTYSICIDSIKFSAAQFWC